MLKNYILRVLHLVRRALTTIKIHALPNYDADKTCFEIFDQEEIIDCYKHFKKYFYKSIFLSTTEIRKYSIKNVLDQNDNDNHFYLEFGVFSGTTINFFSSNLKSKSFYGFDSFEGLKEDWSGTIYNKGFFNLNGKIPKLNSNVIPVKGWVQNTLPLFLDENRPKIKFVHMDLDTYESTLFVLKKIKPFLEPNAIILFDQLYNFSGWKSGEYKALSESFKDEEYQFLAFASIGRQAVIKVL